VCPKLTQKRRGNGKILVWHGQGAPPATNADGKKDHGDIHSLLIDGHR
jgi:hypothetical protein